ncbi:MAG TPA: hypothetical protein VNS19_19885 [Acidimicrobiales bacterium]|jgi:hypothetical protein|nr:hypothetical protein [Acidimicrobiales bacterium]
MTDLRVTKQGNGLGAVAIGVSLRACDRPTRRDIQEPPATPARCTTRGDENGRHNLDMASSVGGLGWGVGGIRHTADVVTVNLANIDEFFALIY